jgi:hypothetical protein
MNRRGFLRDAAALGAVAVVPMIQGCEAYSRTNQEEAPDTGPVLGRIGSRLGEALRLAAMAPSGHNAQPWTVRIVSRSEWVIGSDRRRWLPAVDPFNRELLLSIGAFLENLAVAARNWGQEVESRVIAASPMDSDLVVVRLRPTRVVAEGIEAIRRRRTLRTDFSRRELGSADFSHLTQGLPGFHFFPCASAEARHLASGSVEAMRTQVARDNAQAELARWIRWSDEDAERHMDGLTAASMEIEGIAGWYVRHFYTPDDVMGVTFRARTVDSAAAQAANCGGWVVLTGEGQDVAGLIETGRVFERFFLRARERRVAVHPVSQMLEEAPWRGTLAAELRLDRPVQFVLRVGYRDPYPAPVSLRMPLSAFVRA